jgi:hypothetical protein
MKIIRKFSFETLAAAVFGLAAVGAVTAAVVTGSSPAIPQHHNHVSISWPPARPGPIAGVQGAAVQQPTAAPATTPPLGGSGSSTTQQPQVAAPVGATTSSPAAQTPVAVDVTSPSYLLDAGCKYLSLNVPYSVSGTLTVEADGYASGVVYMQVQQSTFQADAPSGGGSFSQDTTVSVSNATSIEVCANDPRSPGLQGGVQFTATGTLS